MPRIALYQPDIPQNCGAIMRLCACFNVALDLIEPFGFVWDEKQVKRVAMDYINNVDLTRHQNWETFVNSPARAVAGTAERPAYNKRLVLMTTKAALPYTEFQFQKDDILLLGRESAGVPEEVHGQVDARIVIPLQNGMRSLNVGMSAAIVLSEAQRQIAWQTRNT